MELFQFILDFYIVPVFLWLLYIHIRQQNQEISIRVIETMALQVKQNHEKEMGEFREMVNRVYTKLDGIERFLRHEK